MSLAASSVALDGSAHSAPIPIIDTHIHLFDVTRPQGVPWPPKDNKVLYHSALPDRFLQVTKGLGVVGAIEIECSPWLEDNQWVLDVAAKNPIIVGTIGDLEPGKPGFGKHLERFHRNPLFRGIRCGNLWGRNLAEDMAGPSYISDLKLLAGAGLGLDTANPDPTLVAALVRLNDKIPNLRLVLDHTPELELPPDPQQRKHVEDDLRELASRPHVYFKLSGVLRHVNGKVPLDLAFYRSRLDELWGIFGEDRVLYGSDWTNSDTQGTYQQGFNVIHGFISSKTREAQEKFYWKNSVQAYHWVKRSDAVGIPG